MMLPYESMELEYYTHMIRKIANERGFNTWQTAKIIEIKKDVIVFGMIKVMGKLSINKSLIQLNLN